MHRLRMKLSLYVRALRDGLCNDKWKINVIYLWNNDTSHTYGLEHSGKFPPKRLMFVDGK